jgi:hypothetical protein
VGIFDPAGDYDESSPLYWLRDRDMRALDQAIKARRSAARAELGSASRVERLEQNLMALGLYARTMLTLLHEKGLISPQEFSEKLKQIDLMDGELDGR